MIENIDAWQPSQASMMDFCLLTLTKRLHNRFFFYIYNLQFFKQKFYSHQVFIYLNLTGIPVKKPLQNSQIVEEQLDVWILGAICARFLTGRHLLTNKKDKNSRYIKYNDNLKKNLIDVW